VSILNMEPGAILASKCVTITKAGDSTFRSVSSVNSSLASLLSATPR